MGCNRRKDDGISLLAFPSTNISLTLAAEHLARSPFSLCACVLGVSGAVKEFVWQKGCGRVQLSGAERFGVEGGRR